MKSAVHRQVPMLHVKDVPRSIAFYQLLGYRVHNTFIPPGASTPAWAWLESGGACLMVSQASEPVVPEVQAVLFYHYTESVESMRASLVESGLAPGGIHYPFYAKDGEFRLIDPDGYVLMIMQGCAA